MCAAHWLEPGASGSTVKPLFITFSFSLSHNCDCNPVIPALHPLFSLPLSIISSCLFFFFSPDFTLLRWSRLSLQRAAYDASGRSVSVLILSSKTDSDLLRCAQYLTAVPCYSTCNLFQDLRVQKGGKKKEWWCEEYKPFPLRSECNVLAGQIGWKRWS